MNGLTLITPTGDRPAAFALCERWMDRQTYSGPLQWIVVDDGKTPTQCTQGQYYIRRIEPGVVGGSLNRNMIHALRLVAFSKIVMVEDDDWYCPTYLETMSKLLDYHELVGEGKSRYYHVPNRQYLPLQNRKHASLCQTGFRSHLIPQVDRACRSSDFFIDLRIWNIPCNKHLIFSHNLCVGIKGLPGRGGYGIGHRPDHRFRDDPQGEFLRTCVADDADIYLNINWTP